MNCAIHAESPAVAYCRTCGKPMCEICRRDVRGVIYCEECIATRLQSPGASGIPPAAVVVTSGPSPALAGVLAAVFPFGVGAVYVGQYAKGLAHLVVFTVLVAILSSNLQPAEFFGPVFGIALAFFYVYQVIDAVRSARAVQLGQPAPDPFALGKLFGNGERLERSSIPVGSVVLIALGVLFLLGNLGLLQFYHIGRFWPVILIVLGVWLFVRRWRVAA